MPAKDDRIEKEDSNLPIVVLRLGSPRKPNEGLGTVRRRPRGVRKTQFAKLDFYDVSLPNLASQALVGRFDLWIN